MNNDKTLNMLDEIHGYISRMLDIGDWYDDDYHRSFENLLDALEYAQQYQLLSKKMIQEYKEALQRDSGKSLEDLMNINNRHTQDYEQASKKMSDSLDLEANITQWKDNEKDDVLELNNVRRLVDLFGRSYDDIDALNSVDDLCKVGEEIKKGLEEKKISRKTAEILMEPLRDIKDNIFNDDIVRGKIGEFNKSLQDVLSKDGMENGGAENTERGALGTIVHDSVTLGKNVGRAATNIINGLKGADKKQEREMRAADVVQNPNDDKRKLPEEQNGDKQLSKEQIAEFNKIKSEILRRYNRVKAYSQFNMNPEGFPVSGPAYAEIHEAFQPVANAIRQIDVDKSYDEKKLQEVWRLWNESAPVFAKHRDKLEANDGLYGDVWDGLNQLDGSFEKFMKNIGDKKQHASQIIDKSKGEKPQIEKKEPEIIPEKQQAESKKQEQSYVPNITFDWLQELHEKTEKIRITNIDGWGDHEKLKWPIQDLRNFFAYSETNARGGALSHETLEKCASVFRGMRDTDGYDSIKNRLENMDNLYSRLISNRAEEIMRERYGKYLENPSEKNRDFLLDEIAKYSPYARSAGDYYREQLQEQQREMRAADVVQKPAETRKLEEEQQAQDKKLDKQNIKQHAPVNESKKPDKEQALENMNRLLQEYKDVYTRVGSTVDPEHPEVFDTWKKLTESIKYALDNNFVSDDVAKQLREGHEYLRTNALHSGRQFEGMERLGKAMSAANQPKQQRDMRAADVVQKVGEKRKLHDEQIEQDKKLDRQDIKQQQPQEKRQSRDGDYMGFGKIKGREQPGENHQESKQMDSFTRTNKLKDGIVNVLNKREEKMRGEQIAKEQQQQNDKAMQEKLLIKKLFGKGSAAE